MPGLLRCGIRALVLAPHTDDAELGCGGTIARMIDEGAQICVAAFSSAEDSLPPKYPRDQLKNEFKQAAAVLGVPSQNIISYEYRVRTMSYHRQEVLDKIIELRREFAPDAVFVPSRHDVHQDHQVLYAESVRAFKDLTLLGYELPWNHVTFSAEAFSVLESRHIESKWKALQSYESQIDLKRPYFSREFVEGLAKVRGIQVKAEWAEAFEVVRIRL